MVLKEKEPSELVMDLKDLHLKKNLIPPHETNFEIQKYYQNEYSCNGVYSRNNLHDR